MSLIYFYKLSSSSSTMVQDIIDERCNIRLTGTVNYLNDNILSEYI
ncbi:hypothetical protein [Rosenbergiella collisarenosi]|nr:hypothetical protein [Rosenbergiella collisarenosi]MBT0721817.1 hypothetical protein [Rosenbergiella collisarenosi]